MPACDGWRLDERSFFHLVRFARERVIRLISWRIGDLSGVEAAENLPIRRGPKLWLLIWMRAYLERFDCSFPAFY